MSNFQETIQAYLDTEKIQNPKLAEAMLKEGKTIEACCIHIMGKAKELAGSEKALAMKDEDVYAVAVDYYFTDKPIVEKVHATVSAGVRPPVAKAVEKPKVKKSPEGQLTLFDF